MSTDRPIILVQFTYQGNISCETINIFMWIFIECWSNSVNLLVIFDTVEKLILVHTCVYKNYTCNWRRVLESVLLLIASMVSVRMSVSSSMVFRVLPRQRVLLYCAITNWIMAHYGYAPSCRYCFFLHTDVLWIYAARVIKIVLLFRNINLFCCVLHTERVSFRYYDIAIT